MHYLKFGVSKKFMVFLHGWGADLNSFLFVKNYFNDYSKIFVDFYGFGKSPEPNKPFCVADYVKALKTILDNYEIEELVLVGHSFGGRVAIKFAFLYSNDYKNLKLCLVDSAGIRPRLSLFRRLKVRRYKKLKIKAEHSEKIKAKLNNYGSSDYKKLSPLMKQTFTMVVNEDLTAQAQQIKAQTRIIWGNKDKETPISMAKKLNKLIKNSKLSIIKGAGHFSFLENPMEFLIILDSFVKNK